MEEGIEKTIVEAMVEGIVEGIVKGIINLMWKEKEDGRHVSHLSEDLPTCENWHVHIHGSVLSMPLIS
jgi:hypothetical protein